MNLIINFEDIKTLSDLYSYKLRIGEGNIFSDLISQVSMNTVDNIYLLVNPNVSDEFEKLLFNTSKFKKTSLIKLKSKEQIEFAKKISLSDLILAQRTYYNANLKLLLGKEFNEAIDTVLLEGIYLYKKATFNFQESTSDVYVKFEDVNENTSINFMMYFHYKTNYRVNDIKKIVISDYESNFIKINNLESILKSSEAFAENKNLRLRYISELIFKMKFDDIIREIKPICKKNKHWSMLYLEYLLGYGLVDEAVEFVTVSELLDKKKYTLTQRNLYAHNFQMIELIKRGENLILLDILDYIDKQNIDFEYLLNIIYGLKTRNVNMQFLIRKLVETDQLCEKITLQILEEYRKYNLNPIIKLKSIIDISDYFLKQNVTKESISQLLLNNLLSNIYYYEKFIPFSISKKISSYTKSLGLAIREGKKLNLNKFNTDGFEEKDVAVCISGTANLNFKQNLETIKYFIDEKLNADYFVQTWDTYYEFPGVIKNNQLDNDEWAKYYLNACSKFQPQFLARKKNFEAILPQTANLLFTPLNEKLSKECYIDVLGDNLKSIRQYNLSKFKEKFNINSSTFEVLNDITLNNFERYTVQAQMEDYMLENKISYDYVININVDVFLEKKITKEEIIKVQNGELYTMSDKSYVISNHLSLTTFKTSRIVNNLWKLCVQTKNASPYVQFQKEILDSEQNTYLLHLLYNDIAIRTISSEFGNANISRKIRLPHTLDKVRQDLVEYNGDSEKIINYFKEIDRRFSGEIKNSNGYKKVYKAKLLESTITSLGVKLKISITGKGLKSIPRQRFNLFGVSSLSFDSANEKKVMYKQGLEFLKYDDDEIISEVMVLEKDLFRLREMDLFILVHEYTRVLLDIQVAEKTSASYELNRYGMVFIECKKQLKIGIKTKTFLLENEVGEI